SEKGKPVFRVNPDNLFDVEIEIPLTQFSPNMRVFSGTRPLMIHSIDGCRIQRDASGTKVAATLHVMQLEDLVRPQQVRIDFYQPPLQSSALIQNTADFAVSYGRVNKIDDQTTITAPQPTGISQLSALHMSSVKPGDVVGH